MECPSGPRCRGQLVLLRRGSALVPDSPSSDSPPDAAYRLVEVEAIWRAAAPTRKALPGPRPGFAGRTVFSLACTRPSESSSFLTSIPIRTVSGACYGLAHLVETRLGKDTLITRDGLVNRAENRAMVEVLDMGLAPIEDVTWQPGDAVVMVDSQPNTGRHSLSNTNRSLCRDRSPRHSRRPGGSPVR